MSKPISTGLDTPHPLPPELTEDETLLYLVNRYRENLSFTPEEEALAHRILNGETPGWSKNGKSG